MTVVVTRGDRELLVTRNTKELRLAEIDGVSVTLRFRGLDRFTGVGRSAEHRRFHNQGMGVVRFGAGCERSIANIIASQTAAPKQYQPESGSPLR